MWRKLLIIIGILAIPTIVQAESKMSEVLGANGVKMLAQDWGQTKYFIENIPYKHENNLILGRHPSPDKVNKYFTTVTAAYLVAINTLDERHSRYLSYALLAVQAFTVYNNARQGIHPEFQTEKTTVVTLSFPF